MSAAVDLALPIIKNYEGLKLKAYICPAGVPTIGYGSTGTDIKMGMTWTQQQAEDRLRSDVNKFEAGVLKLLTRALAVHELAALISFTYNIGLGAFGKSSLRRRLNAGDPNASEELLRWNKGGGRVLAGLNSRRGAEKSLFDNGSWAA